jgi:hypothetical protein
MKTQQVIIFAMLATLTSAITIDTTTAQARVRTRNAAKDAAIGAESEALRQQNQGNQNSPQQRWDNASPNEKAATYNIARTKHQQKLTKQADAEAAVSKHK